MSGDAVLLDPSEMASKETHTDMPESENVSVTQTRKDESNPKPMFDVKEELVKTDGTTKRSSFDLITTRSGLQNFDKKYRNDGKYATSFPKPLNSSGPGRTAPTPARELPKIGPLLASSDSSEGMEDVSSSSGSILAHPSLHFQG